jgi:hypothetical protein
MEEKKFYQVFSIDICFTSYAIDYVFVGGESAEDIRNHFKDIFPDEKIEVCEYTKDEYPDKEIGDIVYEPQYTDGEIEEIFSSAQFPRIAPVKDVYTTTPYCILDSIAYYE